MWDAATWIKLLFIMIHILCCTGLQAIGGLQGERIFQEPSVISRQTEYEIIFKLKPKVVELSESQDFLSCRQIQDLFC